MRFLAFFPSFPRDFRGSASLRNPCFFGGFPCFFQKRQRRSGWVDSACADLGCHLRLGSSDSPPGLAFYFMGPWTFAWICCPQLPYHPGRRAHAFTQHTGHTPTSFRSENENFAVPFAKPFTFASEFHRNAEFAAFCLGFGGSNLLANARGASEFAFAFAAVSLRPRCTRNSIRDPFAEFSLSLRNGPKKEGIERAIRKKWLTRAARIDS